jgi:hypothetical protein
MRKPMLQAIVMGVVAVAGMLIAQHGLEMPYVPGVSAMRQPGRAWFIFGLGAIAIGGWFSLRAGIIAWMRRRLIDSEEVLARWTVSPGDWAALTGRRPPKADTQVTVDTEAVVVGDACTPIPASLNLLTYTKLASIDWLEGEPGMGGMLVLSRAFRSLHTSYINFLRLPVPEAARGEAQAAIDALDPLVSADFREWAERRFESELAAARSGDPEAAAEQLARKLMSGGGWTAVMGGIAWWVSTLGLEPANRSSAWWMMPVGITAFGVGLTVFLVGLAMIAISTIRSR